MVTVGGGGSLFVGKYSPGGLLVQHRPIVLVRFLSGWCVLFVGGLYFLFTIF